MSQRRPLEISFDLRVPAGDERERRVCTHCEFIDYVNPRVVVGAVCAWEDRILLCRRAIEPRAGYWTVPAGFLEEGETTEEGAARETREEACAEIDVVDLLGVYNVPHISQVQIFYRARLLRQDVAPGPESREVGLFLLEEIPWGELAFESVTWTLERYGRVRGADRVVPFRFP